MSDMQTQESTDLDVRREIYERFIATGRAPLAEEITSRLGLSVDQAKAAFQRLAAGHVIVLQPASGEILMANPFSAVPTGFLVEAGGISYWGNCIWDALGIAAMLKQDASIRTGCGDCNEAMTLDIESREIHEAEGIIHFAIPALHWWDNIVFT